MAVPVNEIKPQYNLFYNTVSAILDLNGRFLLRFLDDGSIQIRDIRARRITFFKNNVLGVLRLVRAGVGCFYFENATDVSMMKIGVDGSTVTCYGFRQQAFKKLTLCQHAEVHNDTGDVTIITERGSLNIPSSALPTGAPLDKFGAYTFDGSCALLRSPHDETKSIHDDGSADLGPRFSYYLYASDGSCTRLAIRQLCIATCALSLGRVVLVESGSGKKREILLFTAAPFDCKVFMQEWDFVNSITFDHKNDRIIVDGSDYSNRTYSSIGLTTKITYWKIDVFGSRCLISSSDPLICVEECRNTCLRSFKETGTGKTIAECSMSLSNVHFDYYEGGARIAEVSMAAGCATVYIRNVYCILTPTTCMWQTPRFRAANRTFIQTCMRYRVPYDLMFVMMLYLGTQD
jgi:hypothetical protein